MCHEQRNEVRHLDVFSNNSQAMFVFKELRSENQEQNLHIGPYCCKVRNLYSA